MKPSGGGNCQRGVRRCLWANRTASTSEILLWAYPRGISNRVSATRAVRRAAERVAIRIGRSPKGKGRPTMWRLKEPDR
jgi:hypothetical protein